MKCNVGVFPFSALVKLEENFVVQEDRNPIKNLTVFIVIQNINISEYLHM